MSLCQADRSQEAPGHAVEVAAVEGVLIVAIDQSLMVEVQHLKQEERVWMHQQMRRVIDEEL